MIDSAGNITLNKASDFFLPIDRVDESGNVVDISTADLTFIVKGRFTLVPDRDPNNSSGRLIHFTEAHALQVSASVSFILRETTNGIHSVLWSGTIAANGFLV